jgi:hypothetical protein
MTIRSALLRSIAMRIGLAALVIVLIEVVYPAAMAAQTGL